MMKRILQSLLLVLIIGGVSCQSSDSSRKMGKEKRQANIPKGKEKMQALYFSSAAVYSDRVEYAFTTELYGEEYVLVNGPALGEKSSFIPDNLLVSPRNNSKDLPKENPEMLGKLFRVYFNTEDVPYRVEAIN